MSFQIIRNDITKVKVDAIVNTANPMPVIGRGTDSAIYRAAGVDDLLAARKKIGVIERGQSAWTDSFRLKESEIRYIIHTVGISYIDGKKGETEILRSCYSTSLNIAKELGCKSVAIPLLATGFYSFPKELGLQIAIDEISRFVIENEIDVILVVYDRQSYLISEKLFNDVKSYIDENYIEDVRKWYPGLENTIRSFEPESIRFFREPGIRYDKARNIEPVDVDAFIIQQSSNNLNFQNTLKKLIQERNLENSEVYSNALVDRKFFSKIINNKDYVPKKMTVMALGLALKLKMDDFVAFMASAGYTFMPSSKFDLIIQYCVKNSIYNLIEVDTILDSHGEKCFAPE